MGFLKLTDGLGHLMQAVAQKVLKGRDARELLKWLREPQHLFSLLAMREFVFFRKDAQSVRQFMADFFAGEIITIADRHEEKLEGESSGSGDPSAEIPNDNTETVARSKLRIDTRRWLMAQFAPATYGPVNPNATASGYGKGIMNAIRAKVYLPENQRGLAPISSDNIDKSENS